MKKPDIVKHGHLDERTVQFGLLGMWVCNQLPSDYAGRHVADQLFRASTSVAANYAEACEPESNADFIHKMKVAMKELKESRVWLRFAIQRISDASLTEIIRESFEIQRMMGASLKGCGYTGWSSSRSQSDSRPLSQGKPSGTSPEVTSETSLGKMNTEN